MKNSHEWKLKWVELDPFPGVPEHWQAWGDMYGLEVQVQDDDTVVGTVWKRIPPTFWEPEDVICIHEQTYESANEAKFLLEKLDADDAQAEREADDRLAEEIRSFYEDQSS